MKRSLVPLCAAALFLCAALAEGAPRQRARVGRSLKNDLSPALRSLRPVPPRRGKKIREMPGPRRTPGGAAFPDLEDQVVQSSIGPGPLATPAPSASFEGMPNVSGAVPPDTNGDIGPAHFVQMVNTTFQIWDKSGTPLYGPADISTLWAGFGTSCESTDDGDPVVLYDSIADRWLLSQFVAIEPFYGECIAISQTGDPTGAHYRYYFPLSTTVFYDYPKFGVWPDAYFMSVNKFDDSGVQPAALAFERSQMLLGLPAGYQEFELTTGGPSLPADLDGPKLPPAGAPGYFLQIRESQTLLYIYEFHVDWATPANSTFTGPTDIPVAGFNWLCGGFPWWCVPQPPFLPDNTSAPVLDTLGAYLMQKLIYRNFDSHESMVVNHSVEVSTPEPDPQPYAGVRWYELRRTDGVLSLHQQGTFAPAPAGGDPPLWRWMGSIAMDGSGNMGLGYSVSDDTSTYPGIRYTSRLVGDAPGTMPQGEVTLAAGANSQMSGGHRWGDYSSMSIDPADDCTFWYTNEYYPISPANEVDWKTRIGSFGFGPANCTPAPHGTIQGTVKDAQAMVPLSGALVSLDNGQSTVTDASGAYALTVSPGTYDVDATAVARLCGSDPAAPKTVGVADNGMATADFLLPGAPLLAAIGHAIDDSGGNDNGKINRDECFDIDFTLVNNGCRKATAVSAVLSSSTPGVTIQQPNSSYAELPIGSSGASITPFGVLTASNFVCGTDIEFTLTVSTAEGSPHETHFAVPTCQGATVYNGQIDGDDATMNERLGRLPPAASCAVPKGCPGEFITAGNYRYDTHAFTNNGIASCMTVTLDPLTCTGANQLHSSAYLGTFDPANLCQGYLGDNGFDPTAITTYSFELPPGQTATLVVNQAGTDQSCPGYQLTVEWGLDNASGGACGAGSPAMTPVEIAVDAAGNGVLEAGETAVIAPAWLNNGTAAATGLTGAMTNFSVSPVVASFALDQAAEYGTVNPASQASCMDVLNCYSASIDVPGTRPQHWDASFLEALATGETKSWQLHVGASFSDAPASQAFYLAVESLLHAGKTDGCGDGNFCPADPLTRAEAAYLLLRAKGVAPPGCTAGGEMFPDDVPESNPFCPWVEEAATRQIMSECDTLAFCPDRVVTREQMAVFVLKAFEGAGYVPPAPAMDCNSTGDQPYDDVPFDSEFCRWIKDLKSRAVTLGCGAGDYCPNGPVTRDVFVAFLSRTFELRLYAP